MWFTEHKSELEIKIEAVQDAIRKLDVNISAIPSANGQYCHREKMALIEQRAGLVEHLKEITK